MGSDDIKKRKISANKQRRQERKLNRKVQNRITIPKILIVTEGSTEKIYFNQLKRILKLNTLTVEKSSCTDARGIIMDAQAYGIRAIDIKKEYNYIFCILDLDTVKNKEFLSIINDYNSKYESVSSKIYPIITFPCIEFWFILHYQFYNAPFSNKGGLSVGDNTKAQLKKYQSNYHETNEECIAELADLHIIGLYNARSVMKQQFECQSFNPITNIHQLIEVLLEISNRSQNYSYEGKLDKFILNSINI